MNYPTRYILTASRRLVDPFNLQPDQIDPQDIALGLARIPRFLGATTPAAYTVAEHCVRVARALPNQGHAARLAALLHDAHEAYMGDVPKPIRSEIRLTDGRTWEEAEADAMRVIRVRFGLPENLPAHMENAIAATDAAMLACELHQLMGQPPPPPSNHIGQILTDPWTEPEARRAYRITLDTLRAVDLQLPAKA